MGMYTRPPSHTKESAMNLTSLRLALEMMIALAIFISGFNFFYPNYFHQRELRIALSRELAHERELMRMNH